MSRKQLALLEPTLVRQALMDAVKKLSPRVQWHNPVMFIVWTGSLLTTALAIAMGTGQLSGNATFTGAISLWLWFTVLFANFAEALAEGRSKAQANSLKGVKKTAFARKLREPKYGAQMDHVPADELRKGDVVLVEAGDIIPCDGEVIEGGASVDESAITGESAPVIRESGGDFASVTGGTRILSDWLVIQCSVNPGETFLDRMIAMVEGAQRRKTPNEIALTILLVALTIVFLLATATLWPFSAYGGTAVSITVLIALLVCLIPTTIGGLLSAIGVAGMSRMLGANVIATSGRAVEAAGDVDVLLLDKTGTITLGNRQASDFLPAPGVDEKTLADAAQLSSLADETPEGRSIVILAKQRFNLRQRDVQSLHATFVPFTAQTRMSGINIQDRMIRKGSVDAIRRHIEANNGHFPPEVDNLVESVARQGATPLVVAEGASVLGVIALKDIVKGGIKERFAQMRKMGIKTVMITGDNRLTAAAIAAEAGVDDFLSEATPKAGTHSPVSGGRPSGGDDRRRHQRRPGAGAGRRGGGDELRYPGGKRGGQHGGSRLEPDQADRSGTYREADADDARLADHVQYRQRRGEVFRHHSGGFCGNLPAVECPERDAPALSGLGHFERGDLQRADYCLSYSAGAERGEL